MDWYLSLFRNPRVILGTIAGVLFVVGLSGFAKGLSLEEWRNLALILAGLFGLPLAVWRSGVAAQQVRVATKQVELAEAGQNIDRYQKGATMLGDARLSVRQAGVFGLTELAENNFETYHVTVVKLLCSFIKDRSLEQVQEQAPEYEQRQLQEDDRVRREQAKAPAMSFHKTERNPPVRPELAYIAPDCQTALNSLYVLNKTARKQNFETLIGVLDLEGANLTKAILINADLSGSQMHRAVLNWANLQYAEMSGANLAEANLFQANLYGANLSGANLAGADLTGAYLAAADLSSTELAGVDLSRAKGLSLQQLEAAINVRPEYLEHFSEAENEINAGTD